MKIIRDRLIEYFEKADIRLMVFALLCLNYLSFILTSNEEAYLPLAKQFMDPAWIPNSFTFSEWAGNRLIFQWITGWILKYLSFEQVAFWGRLVIFLAISFPVGSLFRKLQIGNLAAILLFQFYLVRQNYFAGEFIFGDYEAKSLAYIMVFAGLNCLLDRKYLAAAAWAVAAAYLHILVGGWFFLVILAFTLFTTKGIIVPLKQFLLFSILIAPFAFYLVRQVFNDGSIVNGINIDQVYVFFRNPHHTAPLAVKQHLLRTSLQIVATVVIFALSLFIFVKKKGLYFHELYLLNIIILSILFISLAISLIDHNGTLLKFYPFRLAAIGLMMMYLYVCKWASLAWRTPVWLQMVLILFGFYLVGAATMNTANIIAHSSSKPAFEELIDYVSHQTAASDIIIPLDDNDLSFSRRTRREVFVNFKFDPGGGKKIYEWYTRIIERNKLLNNTGYLDHMLLQYNIQYVLSNRPLSQNARLNPVFKNSEYYLYKIQ